VNKTIKLSSLTTALGISLCLVQGLPAQTIRLHGAVTLEKLVGAQKGTIEAQTGVKLEIVGNGAGRGLADLSGGQADIAMLAGPLKGVAEAMNSEKPGSVDTAGMKEFALSSIKIAVVTHPAVGIKSLTTSQLRYVLTGKVSNWKEVGGADLPVKVVLPFAGDGARIALRDQVLDGADYIKTAVVRNSAKDVGVVLAQLPGSCSVLSVKNVEDNLVIVATDKELTMPLQLVTKGDPAGDVKKVVEATKGLVK
jgi:phosphate transport system substrate-binding protein